MFNVVDVSTGKASEVNFDQLCRMVGEDLDKIFYLDIYKEHTLTGKKGKLVITEGSSD